MISPDPRILVLGAGAVGSITAGLMEHRGCHVTLLCKDSDLARKISGGGLHLFGHCGDLRVKISACATIEEIREPADIIFLTTKANDMAAAARSVLPLLKTTSRVVCMQNGIMEEALARIVGKDRTVGCVVGFGATMHEPGVVEMTSTGRLLVGYIDREADPAIEQITRILNTVSPTRTTDSIIPHLFSKLIINSCISTLGTISGLDLGPLLAMKRARQLFIAIGKEALQVADCMQIEVPSYGGMIHFRRILRCQPFWQHLLIRLIGKKYKKLRSTNLQSVERGGLTEIDHLNGYIVSQGEANGVAVPVNRRLLQMVKEIEHRRRPITPLNLEDEILSGLIE